MGQNESTIEIKVRSIEELQKQLASQISQFDLAKLDQFKKDNFTKIRLLGKGTYGEVFLVKDKTTKNEYAMKVIYLRKNFQVFGKATDPKDIDGLEETAMVKRGIYTMFLARNANIANMIAVHEENDTINCLFELCEGDLLKFLKELEPKNIILTSEDICDFSLQIIEGLIFLQDKLGISHRDLKPENILYKTKKTPKSLQLMISDFDTVCFSGKTTTKTVTGTKNYMVLIFFIKTFLGP